MNTIKNIIKNKNIKIVSFGIFDTLIEHPCIYQTDIFALLNEEKNKINNKDFYDIRIKIEKEIIDLGNNNPNIYEIYDFLAKKYNLSTVNKETLLNLELELEYNILKERKCIKELYNIALEENKKIIYVSDAYLPSEIIKNILIKNGYKNINGIYVSCDIKRRKDDGSLFEYVLQQEKCLPHEILHIGSNKISDLMSPLKYGIIAYHIPSSINDFFHSKETKEYASIYNDINKYSPSERVALGFSINRFMENKDSIKYNMLFSSPYSLSYNLFGPFLFALCLFIMNNKDIQENYSCILFASRDGWLPKKAYDILTKNNEKYLKSEHIYDGSRAYDIANNIEFYKEYIDKFGILFEDSEIFSDEMKRDLEIIQNAAIDFINDINDLIGKYKNSFHFTIDNLFVKSANYILESITDISIKNLKNIFVNNHLQSNNYSLFQKLRDLNNIFYKSKFVDRNLLADEFNNSIEIEKRKVGIHIHVFYIDILYEIIDYLKESPIEFDLLISVTSEENKNICSVLLNKEILSKLNKLIIKVTINRGRDIAPWLIAFKEEQNNYDYICHIHTKKSHTVSLGDDWRNYLYRNLIYKDSISNILNLFENKYNCGIIFPPFYTQLYNINAKTKVSFFEEDKENILNILSTLCIKVNDLEGGCIFSAGTMFWYKPKALKKLFDLNLSYNDFAKEPIDVKGTLAHAIERLPSIIAEDSGYKTLCYLNNKEAMDFYFNKKYLDIFKEDIVNEANFEDYKLKIPWFTLFGIFNNKDTLRIVLFGIKITVKMNPEKIDKLSRIIPVRKWRDNFREKFKMTGQDRTGQDRTGQDTCNVCICLS